MTKHLTITLPDDVYRSLQTVAGAAHRTPEDVAAQAVLERLSALTQKQMLGTAEYVQELVRVVMQGRQHLVPQAQGLRASGEEALPPMGSPERVRLDAEVAGDLGDALNQSGLSVLDLIERR